MNDKRIKKILLSEEEIQKRVRELGARISLDYQDKNPILITVLKGAFYFLADLTRAIDIPISLDFMAIGVFSGGIKNTGIVRFTKDLDLTITGRHVILVEDIISTGLTVSYLLQQLEIRKPESLKVCTLLDNPALRLVNIPIEYKGFDCSCEQMVGYGLDFMENYRHLPYIAEFREN